MKNFLAIYIGTAAALEKVAVERAGRQDAQGP